VLAMTICPCMISFFGVQTLTLNPQVTLCDCPGLVFPSFVSSQAEMVTNGILPIAHLRDHTGVPGSPMSQ
jgi:ribosome biogenesis GTPase A